MARHDITAIATELMDAFANRANLEPITARVDGFALEDAFEVLSAIATKRRAEGWVPVGRKIGFTNRTIWEVFGVDAPMWAPVWDATLIEATGDDATVPLSAFLEPRIEPEVAFKLRGPVPISDDAEEILSCVEWIAPAFEIVQCVFPGWSFQLPDATAAFGLHGRLVVGTPVAVDVGNRAQLASELATFEATLSRDGEVVDRGTGSNVLDSPALALVHLARVVADQPEQPPLAAGEVITTGTITNAWPVTAGETWSSDYGSLGLAGLSITFVTNGEVIAARRAL